MAIAFELDRADDAQMRDDRPPDRPVRRTFTAAYKLAILEAYEGASSPGEKGALLRREGLYSSHIIDWRRARDAGALAGLAPKPRPHPGADASELGRLRRRAERAEAELHKARLVIEIQGKASELLERLLAESEDEKQRR